MGKQVPGAGEAVGGDLLESAIVGRLEATVMEILWAAGSSSVHEVAARLERPLAYTTVMTTLDRLYKKGLLERRKVERAFVYAPSMTRAEWERKRLAEFLASSQSEMLLSFLVDS